MSDVPTPSRNPLVSSEDWWAVWLAGLVMAGVVAGAIGAVPGVGRWTALPTEAFAGRAAGLAALGMVMAALSALAVRIMGHSARRHAVAFAPLFLLAVAAYTLANQAGVRAAGFGYAFWALIIGLIIANTRGTPDWLKPALRSELYIKTGLVLLGAEVLFGNILRLGGPGLFVAWLVTPVVLVFMYQFGVRFLQIGSRSLVIVIAAATSVCGVSAAIAVAAAARARKQELTLAVGMSLIFTVAMMILMPLGIRWAGMDPVVGAAWIGGTVDATGAVVAAGAILGEQAEQIAAVVKMIQNTLIGLVAFLVAVFWVTRVEATDERKPEAMEIWHRLPKFIIGFVGASLLFSFVLTPTLGEARVAETLDLTLGRARLAVLPGVRQHRPGIEPARPRPAHRGRAAHPALRHRAGVQRRPHAGRRLARLRRHPVRAGGRRGNQRSHRSPARHRDRAQPRHRTGRHAALLHGGRGLERLPARDTRRRKSGDTFRLTTEGSLYRPARWRRKYSTWNSRTLRLCSRSVSANAWVPSLRLTK